MGFSLTKPEARRMILLKQGLLGENRFSGKDGILRFIEQAGCVQYDPIDICGKNSELVLNSRVKGFNKNMLSSILYEDRMLVDYFDKLLSIIAIEDWPNFSRTRGYFQEKVRSKDAIQRVSEEIKSAIQTRGPVSSKDLDHNEKVDWFWGNTRLSRAALEAMYYSGELVIHHKNRSIKYYDLAENQIPLNLLSLSDPHPEESDYHEWHLLRRIGAVGLLWNRASDALLSVRGMKAPARAKAFSSLLEKRKILSLEVEGIRDSFYFRSEDLSFLDQATGNEKLKPRTEFLAPLDSFLWDRKLIKALFDFDYTWEIYTPKEKRKFGYYTLPILSGDRLVGRIEPVLDRKHSTLFVNGLWFEKDIRPTSKLLSEIERTLKRLASLNGASFEERDLKELINEDK